MQKVMKEAMDQGHKKFAIWIVVVVVVVTHRFFLIVFVVVVVSSGSLFIFKCLKDISIILSVYLRDNQVSIS